MAQGWHSQLTADGLLLADTNGLLRETLTTGQSGTLNGVSFSRRDSERLYFVVDYHVNFAINLDGSNMHEVPSDSVDGLPSVQPSGHYSLVTLYPSEHQLDLGIVQAGTGDSSALHAMTYKRCWLGSEWSCWTPNEDAIFFSANEWRISDPMYLMPAEIWKYEPVFDR
jgi:hypothetical protein